MNILDKFKNLTNIDLKNFYIEVLDFFDNYNNEILDYYTIYNYDYPTEAFSKYKSLVKNFEIILSKFVFYKGNFDNIEAWQIIENLDTLKLKLDSVEAYPRLYRVNFIKQQNGTNEIYETYVLKSHESLESIATEYNQNILDLRQINNLKEEDYTDKGGKKIILKSSIASNIEIGDNEETVFDILVGKNLLGKDFPSYFNIDEDIEDLETLSPEQTFINSVQNLFTLKQGGIPEYPNFGIDKNIISDMTKANGGISFPILCRQLSIALESDDTILTFSIEDIELDEQKDAYIIKASVQNRLLDNLKFVTSLDN